jgi:hypothetical protein
MAQARWDALVHKATQSPSLHSHALLPHTPLLEIFILLFYSLSLPSFLPPSLPSFPFSLSQ